jgi:putative endonuclease
MSWTVYILQCADDSLYTGITNDLPQRLIAHENGSGAKYTKGRGPFRVVYQERCKDRSAATKRELEIKALSRTEKVGLFKKRKA